MIPLVDSFGRRITYARVSVTDRCNLRCFYCMPPTGVNIKPAAHLLSAGEFHRLCAILARAGVKKIRITGGEPLVRKDIGGIVSSIASIPGLESVGITTNGVLLADRLEELRSAGLRGLNVSLDTLRPERFEAISCRSGFDAVMRGIQRAVESGWTPLKINVVVIRGVNDDELVGFVDHFRTMPVSLRFIEYMPFKQNRWHSDGFFPYAEMLERIARRFPLSRIENADPSGISKDYSIDGSPLTVGFITAVSHDFCAGCNRLRILADGSVKSCLFYAPEGNLRNLLRGRAPDAEILDFIRAALLRKPLRHPAGEELALSSAQSMIEIGG